jgi:hypothetical protein
MERSEAAVTKTPYAAFFDEFTLARHLDPDDQYWSEKDRREFADEVKRRFGVPHLPGK